MNSNEQMKKMVEDLCNLGVKESGILLVHSSVKSLGDIDGGAESIISALQTAIGKKGTLLMPTITASKVDGEENNRFSLKDTPSEVGLLTEYFRKMKGVKRSMNPTHSVCGIGRYADEILKAHQKDNTPCGTHSPYKILGELGGQILFIGCGLNVNTSMHGIEEMMKVSYLFDKEMEYETINDSKERNQSYFRKYTPQNIIQRYERLETLLEEGKGIKRGKILEAECYLVETKEMWRVAKEALRKDEYYFVDQVDGAN